MPPVRESKILTRRCFWELHRCARHVPFHCFGGGGVVVGGHRLSFSGFPAYWSEVEPFIATVTDLY